MAGTSRENDESDVLSYADGSSEKFRVRSLVGLIPMFAIERLEED